ncbi:MAG: NAD(+) synthase, partial [Bacilli bacterium]|nr:NAD(+) synthase [Bacilli bacterium]
NYRVVEIDLKDKNDNLVRNYDAYPFVPSNESKRAERCSEIVNIQACGLAKRIKHTGMKKCVIGISGGLDSTLAFLVVIEAYRKLGISFDNLIGVTMPGFGTTGRTYNNALTLMKNYGVTMREVSIKEASLQHFKDIGLEETDRSVTYENTQARERTQILMDIANKEGGLVIGTGDLSELALGWCTYNGDHMSMYAVNTSIPKTLVRYLVKYFADIEPNDECKKTILDILDTPISPELLPPSKDGKIEQQTESVVGPYILHDFFLYHFMRYGASPEKIRYIANRTFDGMYDSETIDKWLKFFIKRFFNQQFKRSCLPDGPKVGTISVSPRGDLRMPSDADSSSWLN